MTLQIERHLISLELFKAIWKNHVNNMMKNPGAINSERALQACICNVFSFFYPEWLVLVEQSIPHKEKSTSKLSTDLMICSKRSDNSYHVDVLVEIKIQHLKRKYIDYEEDLTKISEIIDLYKHEFIINMFNRNINVTASISEKTQYICAVYAEESGDSVNPQMELKSAEKIFAEKWKNNMDEKLWLAYGTWNVNNGPNHECLFTLLKNSI